MDKVTSRGRGMEKVTLGLTGHSLPAPCASCMCMGCQQSNRP